MLINTSSAGMTSTSITMTKKFFGLTRDNKKCLQISPDTNYVLLYIINMFGEEKQDALPPVC